MKRIRYSKYVPDPAGEMSMEDLLSALSDYLLQSGFQDSMWYELPQGEQTLDELKSAIEQALLNGEMFDDNLREQIEQRQGFNPVAGGIHGTISLAQNGRENLSQIVVVVNDQDALHVIPRGWFKLPGREVTYKPTPTSLRRHPIVRAVSARCSVDQAARSPLCRTTLLKFAQFG